MVEVSNNYTVAVSGNDIEELLEMVLGKLTNKLLELE